MGLRDHRGEKFLRELAGAIVVGANVRSGRTRAKRARNCAGSRISASRELVPVTSSRSHSSSRAFPSKPVAPMIKTRIAGIWRLLVLSFPVLGDSPMLVRQPPPAPPLYE